MTFRRLAVVLAIVLIPSPCLAFSTPDLPLTDPVYRNIDKLVAADLIQAVIVGQRPYSRMQIAEILLQAKTTIERKAPGFPAAEPLAGTLQAILATMNKRFAPEMRVLSEGGEPFLFSCHPIEEARLSYEYSSGGEARFTPNNGLGGLDGARIDPFAYYRQGISLGHGSRLVADLSSSLRVTPYLSLWAEPRVETPFASGSDSNVRLLQIYGRLKMGNTAFTVGRRSLLWGQGEYSGLQLTENAFPLDSVELSNDIPMLLPSVLSLLGPVKSSFLYADMGGSYKKHPGAYLVGLRVSMQPHPNFEFGVSNLVIGGGEGAPAASLRERAQDVFSFSTRKPLSNRIGGFDARLRLPSLRGTTIYGEMAFDDPNANLKVLFGDETAYLFGLYCPIVDPAGRLSLRAEYHRTGLRFYRHGQFPAVRKGDVLGDPLGPDAQAGYLTAIYDLTDSLALRLDLAAEFRGSDSYAVIDPQGNFHKRVTRRGPLERRYRLVAGVRYRPVSGLGIEGVLGCEQTANFGFRAGYDPCGVYSRLGLDYSFEYGSN
ncbi:MAG: capsule assembly Wzi family protein [Pseudomonadota bacterium]